jgi:hypothetical protein
MQEIFGRRPIFIPATPPLLLLSTPVLLQLICSPNWIYGSSYPSYVTGLLHNSHFVPFTTIQLAMVWLSVNSARHNATLMPWHCCQPTISQRTSLLGCCALNTWRHFFASSLFCLAGLLSTSAVLPCKSGNTFCFYVVCWLDN